MSIRAAVPRRARPSPAPFPRPRQAAKSTARSGGFGSVTITKSMTLNCTEDYFRNPVALRCCPGVTNQRVNLQTKWILSGAWQINGIVGTAVPGTIGVRNPDCLLGFHLEELRDHRLFSPTGLSRRPLPPATPAFLIKGYDHPASIRLAGVSLGRRQATASPYWTTCIRLFNLNWRFRRQYPHRHGQTVGCSRAIPGVRRSPCGSAACLTNR